MSKYIFVDGDPFAYRAAFSKQGEDLEAAIDKVDEVIEEALSAVAWAWDEEDIQVALTGKTNFRYDVAVTYPYKGNRKDAEKPEHLGEVRQHMIDNWGAIVSEGEEADDLLGIWSTEQGPSSIVITIDKDMLQLPCHHYNPMTKKHKTVSDFEGLKFFYTQLLTGDTADNIKGLKGIGPKKAEAILRDCNTEKELYNACLIAYDSDLDWLMENARLLWLRRSIGQMWEPPE
jgi:hypothetical protein